MVQVTIASSLRSARRAVGLVETIGAATSLALLMVAVGTFTSRAREVSRRRLCAVNLKLLGTTCKIYANEIDGDWPTPAFRNASINQDGIDYVNNGFGTSFPATDAGEVGFGREFESTSESELDPSGGSTAVSTTRAFWILVRSGAVAPAQFICPSSGDVVDPTVKVESYYDFRSYQNISYGYLVPFGPRDTRPNERGSHPSKVFVADKGPFYRGFAQPQFYDERGVPLTPSHTPYEWRFFNSPNHGGFGNGEGQNLLYADGRVSFERRPTAGIDNDNLYTVINDNWDFLGFNLFHGDTPHLSPWPYPYPGQDAFGPGGFRYSSTDSLIYP